MGRSDADDAGIAVDAGLIGACRPIHHHLRLGKQQRIGAVEIAAQRGDLVARGRLQPRPARARAYQHDRGDDGEQHEPEHHDQHGDFMPVDAVLGARHELVQRENRLLLGAGGEGKDGADNGGQESASPRMRAAAADPDRVRHAPSPLLAATTAHCQRIIAGKSPANRSTLLSSGIAPKESRS